MKKFLVVFATLFLITANAYAVKTVLLVDGSPSLKQQLSMVLASNGYAVQEAGDAKDAISRMASFGRLDLIITNISFNRPPDGYQFISQLRANPNFTRTPIIVLTTDTSPSTIAKIKSTGANNFQGLPTNFDVLATKVNAMIGK